MDNVFLMSVDTEDRVAGGSFDLVNVLTRAACARCHFLPTYRSAFVIMYWPVAICKPSTSSD